MNSLLFGLIFIGLPAVERPLQEDSLVDIVTVVHYLQPDGDKEWTLELASAIYAVSKNDEDIDPYLLIAIGMQESRLRNVIRYDSKGKPADWGVWQLHKDTAEAYGLEVERTLTDVHYAAKAAVTVLRKKLRYCKDLGAEAWTCYHSRTEHFRVKYLKMVNKFYMGNRRIINGP